MARPPKETASTGVHLTPTARQELHDLQHAGESYSETIHRISVKLNRDPDAREGGSA